MGYAVTIVVTELIVIYRLLAILIGRLGLTIIQAEKEYHKIMEHAVSALLDATNLDCTLKAIVKKYTGDPSRDADVRFRITDKPLQIVSTLHLAVSQL